MALTQHQQEAQLKKIPLFKNAIWNDIKNNIKDEVNKMMGQEQSSEQELRDYFIKTTQKSVLLTTYHRKSQKIKDGNTWITTDIQRLIRARDKHYYKKKKKSTDSDHHNFFFLNGEWNAHN